MKLWPPFFGFLNSDTSFFDALSWFATLDFVAIYSRDLKKKQVSEACLTDQEKGIYPKSYK